MTKGKERGLIDDFIDLFRVCKKACEISIVIFDDIVKQFALHSLCIMHQVPVRIVYEVN